MSTACGAGIGAFKAVKDLDSEPAVNIKGDDMQMDIIKGVIWEQRERIKSAANANAEVTYVLYETLQDRIMKIVDPKILHGGKIVMLGGIQINVEPDDYFEPKCLIMLDGHGNSTDLLPQLFAGDTIQK